MCAFQNIYQAFATAHRYLNFNVSCMYMKTGDSASPGSAIKLHGIVSYLIVPLKMFIYGKKDENNLRRCNLEFAKIIICQKKKKKMIAKICHSEICFDEPAVLEQ